MTEKTKTTIGLVLTFIAIIISFTVPEIRFFLGLDEEVKNDIEKIETSTEEVKDNLETFTEIETTPQKESPPVNNPQKKEPNIIEIKEEKQQLKKFDIFDEESGKKDFKFENYFKEITNDLGYNQIIVNGSKSIIDVSRNKSVPNQLRVAIDLNISIDNKPLILSTIYGRGDTEKEAINHALLMNKENITNKIKLLK